MPPLAASSASTAYALACGLPPLLVAAAGDRMRRATREPASLPDYLASRHGPIAAGVTVAISLFNQAVVLLAELVVIGSIFEGFVGGPWRIIVIAVAALTAAYTSAGGLLVSIATDQVQGVASIVVAVALIAWVAATHAGGLPRPLQPPLAPSTDGATSFFTLGASLAASLAFQEGMWQRVWAAASTRALRGGAAMGAALTAAIVFAAGWGGVLAIGGGLINDKVNPNLYLFELLSPHSSGASTRRAAVDVIVALLAMTMNMSSVDTLMNGIAATLSGGLRGRPLWVTRAAVVAVAAPITAIALATPATSVLALFLVTNLMCCCALPPLALSLAPAPALTQGGFLAGVGTGAVALSALGIAREHSFARGLRWAWYGNEYDWRTFLTALGASTAATLAAAAVAALVCRGGAAAGDVDAVTPLPPVGKPGAEPARVVNGGK